MKSEMRLKTEILELRVTPEAKDLIRKSSNLKGQKMSEFVLAAAMDEAQKVLERQHILRLEGPYFEQFMALLDEPVQLEDLSPALVSAFQTYARNPVVPEPDP